MSNDDAITSENTINYESRRHVRSIGPGYVILLIANSLVGLASIPLIVMSVKARGYGALGAALLDMTLFGAQVLIAATTMVYAALRSTRYPMRTGRALTWLILTSAVATAAAGAALLALRLAPNSAVC
jgi:hypothetical protein